MTQPKWLQSSRCNRKRYIRYVQNVTIDGELFIKKKCDIWRLVKEEVTKRETKDTIYLTTTKVYENVAKQTKLFE